MKASDIIKILEKYPDANVTLSVSYRYNSIFADKIIEITEQGGSQLTIVADINNNIRLISIPKIINNLKKIEHNLRTEKNYYGVDASNHIGELFQTSVNKSSCSNELQDLIFKLWEDVAKQATIYNSYNLQGHGRDIILKIIDSVINELTAYSITD